MNAYSVYTASILLRASQDVIAKYNLTYTL